MVGALARMNLNAGALHGSTPGRACPSMLGKKAFPTKNIFSNNLAQAIEILHCIDHSSRAARVPDPVQGGGVATPIVIKEGEGSWGCMEAPRGTLYYMLSIDKKGDVQYGNIIVPTQQNQMCMEKSVMELVQPNLGQEQGVDRVRDREADKGL